MNAKLLERINFLCYDLLGKTELGNTVDKHAACGVKCLVNGDVIATLCKITCAGKTGRTGTNDGNSVSVALGFYGLFGAEGIVPVCNKSFQTTDTNRLTLDASDTLGLTLRFLRTNTTANSGKRRGLGDDLICALKVALFNLRNKLGDVNFNGAAGNAGHILAVQTSVCLIYCLLLCITECNLLKIVCAYLRILYGHFVSCQTHICLCHFTVPPF